VSSILLSLVAAVVGLTVAVAVVLVDTAAT
jgi:hypothetical protein